MLRFRQGESMLKRRGFRQGESMLKRRGIMQIGAVFGSIKTPYPEHRTAAAG